MRVFLYCLSQDVAVISDLQRRWIGSSCFRCVGSWYVALSRWPLVCMFWEEALGHEGRNETIKTCVIIRDDAVRTMHVFVLSEPAWRTFMLSLLFDQAVGFLVLILV